jgi:glycosyltransferase involved in cell wall biosynthesis
MSAPSISIVVPVYRSSRSLPELVERLVQTLDPLDREYELVLVDDCSPDDSWAVLEQLRERYGTRLKIASLARNQGQHNAVLCGFSLATGAVVVTMDDDLQNPPEEVPRMVTAIDEGFDLAIGSYDSKRHSRVRNRSGQVIDRLIRRIFRLPRDFALTSFRAANGRIVRQAAEMSGVYPYVTCMLLTHSARPTNVAVRHDERKFGNSNYSLRRSLSLAANLLFSYSSAPVGAVAVVCGVAVGGALATAAAVAVVALAGSTVPGWASTLLAVAISNAVTLACLTVLAIYVGRMNRQLSGPRVSFTIRALHE